MARRAKPLVLVSGFGPFEQVERNPSGEIARALAARPPAGLRVVARVLPASFARGPRGWDALLARSGTPVLCLALGVAKRPGFRLERWASPRLKLVPRPDVDGHSAHAHSRRGARLATSLPLAPVRAALRRRGVERVRVSSSAGGYVCERVYHHLLQRAAERGLPALFVHVPPLRFTPLARQVQVVRWILAELLREGASAAGPRTRRVTPPGRGVGSPRARTAGRRRRRARAR
ncbi:MAG TPA: hypothetical protein VF530_01095 [Planctomycetota bacterium]